MHVRWLQLSSFRNFASLSFEPDPGLNVLIGANGQGKTSLLEAIHLLLAGRSFRTTRLPECVAWDAPAANVAGAVEQLNQYLEERNLAQVIEDAGEVARRHPGMVIGGMFLTGLALGRFLKASESRQGEESDDDGGEEEEESPRASSRRR